MRHKQICERTNNNVYTNNNEVAIEFWRKQEHECSTARMFVRLFVLDYKTTRLSRRQVVRIQSALCEAACKEKQSLFEDSRCKDLSNRC